MRLFASIVLVFLALLVPAEVSAQAIDLNSGAGQSLQNTGSGLQQPISGVQGTTPDNLTPSQGTALNQSTPGNSTFSQKLGPPSGTNTIAADTSQKKNSIWKIVLYAVILIAVLYGLLRQVITVSKPVVLPSEPPTEAEAKSAPAKTKKTVKKPKKARKKHR